MILATTTSTVDTGLLDLLNPVFERKYNLKVVVLALGTGQALETAKRGDADIVLVHAKPLEDKFLADGDGIHRAGVMFNDFVILGPPDDPARVSESREPVEAFRMIASAGADGKALFVSRADNSGTNVRELTIWKKAGISPQGPWYIESGAGMGSTLTLANEKRAYTLSDRGTFGSYQQKIRLKILLAGGNELLNPYGVILVNPERHKNVNFRMAQAYAKFLLSEEGQRLIGAFKKDDVSLFTPIARDIEKAKELGYPDQEKELTYYDSLALTVSPAQILFKLISSSN